MISNRTVERVTLRRQLFREGEAGGTRGRKSFLGKSCHGKVVASGLPAPLLGYPLHVHIPDFPVTFFTKFYTKLNFLFFDFLHINLIFLRVRGGLKYLFYVLNDFQKKYKNLLICFCFFIMLTIFLIFLSGFFEFSNFVLYISYIYIYIL